MRGFVAAIAVLAWFLGSIVVPLYTSSELVIRGALTLPFLLILLTTQISKPFSLVSFVLISLFCGVLFAFGLSHSFWLLVPLGVLTAAIWWVEKHRSEAFHPHSRG
jgi:uncharacterized membrane protein